MLYLINQNGETSIISNRDPATVTKCVIAPSTKSGWRIADRTDYCDGLIPASVGLAAGEVVSVTGKSVLVMSIMGDTRGVTSFLGARANRNIDWYKQFVSVDTDNAIVVTWSKVQDDVPAFCQLVTATLRQEDPVGLLPNTKYLVYIPFGSSSGDLATGPYYLTMMGISQRSYVNYEIARMDRVVIGTVSCQVDELDPIIMDGILRLQCSEDTRL